jgi:hypothetical protein
VTVADFLLLYATAVPLLSSLTTEYFVELGPEHIFTELAFM